MQAATIPIFLAFTFICGCLTPAVSERYVCADGWVTESYVDCSDHTPKCPKTDCPKNVCPPCEPKISYVVVNVSSATVSPSDPCGDLGCPPGTQYVASKTSKKYHTCSCRFAKVLSAKNRICYSSAAEAEAEGKEPCGICAVNIDHTQQ